MAEREVKIGLISYKAADGSLRDGFYGETVDVHGDDVKRFDAANKYLPTGDCTPPPAPLNRVDASAGSSPAEADGKPARRRKNTAPAKPSSTSESARAAWVEYANAQGAQGDFEGVSVKEIAEMFSE